MIKGEGIVDGKAKELTRKMVAEWLVDIYNNVPKEIGQNAWKKPDFDWLTNKTYFKFILMCLGNLDICITAVAGKQCPHATIF